MSRLLCVALAWGILALPGVAGELVPPPPKEKGEGDDTALKPRPGFARMATEHFYVQTTASPAMARGYATICERAYRRFCEIFDVPKDETVWDGKCEVLLFAARKQFMKFAASDAPHMAQAGGYAHPTKENPRVVMPMYGRDRVQLEQVLIHELSHVFLQLYRKQVNLPIWLHEGCAQFFEFLHHPADSRLRRSKAIAKALVAAGKSRPLAEFCVTPFPPTDGEGYAQAWSLIHYLTQNPRTRGKIGKFILKLKEMVPEHKGFIEAHSEEELARLIKEATGQALEPQARALQEIFGMTIEDFERSWKKFVLTTY